MRNRSKGHEKNRKIEKLKKGVEVLLIFMLVDMTVLGNQRVFLAAQPQMPSEHGAAKAQPEGQRGDANEDGIVTILDARLVLRAALNLELIEAYAYNNADVDMDGWISLRDAGFVLKFALNLMDASHFVCVGKGADFQTINEAVSYAQTFCSRTDRVLIFIGEGIYQEEITLLDNPGIDMEGCGAGKTVIEQQSWYPNAPLYTTGTGTFKNIEFIAKGPTNTYAMHFEINGGIVKGVATFQNCFFSSEGNAAVGIGMGADNTVIFKNCSMGSDAGPCIYVHNSAYNNQPNQNFIVENCRLLGVKYAGSYVAIDDAAMIWGAKDSPMGITFRNVKTQFPGAIVFRKTMEESYQFIPDTGVNIRLTHDSGGNDLAALNRR